MPAPKQQLTLLIVRGSGRGTLRISLPSLPVLGQAAVSLLVLGIMMGAGFGLQRAQGPHPSTLTIARVATGADRFSMFHLILPRTTEATAADVLRRASLLHALKLGLGTMRSASTLHSGVVLPEWQADAEVGDAHDGTLLWPVREGYYVRGFGAGSGGYHLAVDIQGSRGASVLAAAPGVVGYAASTLRGYGNAIMIVHPGNQITLYAHNERNEVVPGQRVKRGQRIAALGSTGISRGPHVHFEFLQGGQNCDPLPLFRPVRSRANHLGDIEQATWLPNQPRPKQVRCDRRRQHPDSRWHDHEEGGDPIDSQPIAAARAPQ